MAKPPRGISEAMNLGSLLAIASHLTVLGIVLLGAALFFCIAYAISKLLEIAVADIGNLFIITHSDRREEHAVLASDRENVEANGHLGTQGYPEALTEHALYLKVVRELKVHTIDWAKRLALLSSLIFGLVGALRLFV